jgi:hypothetical protein
LGGFIGTLADAVGRMQQSPECEVLILGHTDTSGPVAYNNALSEKRAMSVKAILDNDAHTFVDIATSTAKQGDLEAILHALPVFYGWEIPVLDGAVWNQQALQRAVAAKPGPPFSTRISACSTAYAEARASISRSCVFIFPTRKPRAG